MAVMGLREVSWGFGDPPLLEKISLQVEKGERVGVVGRNGVGKSTLLRLLSGDLLPDSGEVWRRQGLVVSAMAQEVPTDLGGTVFQVVAAGLEAPSEAGRKEKEVTGAWRVDRILSQVGIDPALSFSRLSAGQKRQVLFARAMVSGPDVLLLDEPTNHLDIGTIEWLEGFIDRNVKTLVFITHDRTFLQRVAGRIVEIDRGGVTAFDGRYAAFLEKKEAILEAEARQMRVFDKKLEKEEAWIRQGVKARRTRNEGRVRALEALREKRKARRLEMGDTRMRLQEAERSGKLVIEARGICAAYETVPLFADFSTVILRGDRVGIIGPNGSGKTTLLKVLLKEAAPDTGAVRHGTRLEVAYFDQLRLGLDEEKSVKENVAEGNDFIVFNNEKRHVIGYLQDFLFTPERCRTPVRVLSGGEKNRLMLAKLFTRPANLLVLDEPTNDLDTETLELLEEVLLSYPGTLLVVSHDRSFLNNVVTSTIAFEGGGRLTEYAGGWDDYLLQRPEPEKAAPEEPKAEAPKPRAAAPSKPKKLGYMQERELAALPGRIDLLEKERDALFSEMADPLFYQKEKGFIASRKERLARLEEEIEAAYARWEVLDAMGGE